MLQAPTLHLSYIDKRETLRRLLPGSLTSCARYVSISYVRFWDIINPRDFTSTLIALSYWKHSSESIAPCSCTWDLFPKCACRFMARSGKRSKKIGWGRAMNRIKKWGPLVWIADMSFELTSVVRAILVSNKNRGFVHLQIWFPVLSRKRKIKIKFS